MPVGVMGQKDWEEVASKNEPLPTPSDYDYSISFTFTLDELEHSLVSSPGRAPAL